MKDNVKENALKHLKFMTGQNSNETNLVDNAMLYFSKKDEQKQIQELITSTKELEQGLKNLSIALKELSELMPEKHSKKSATAMSKRKQPSKQVPDFSKYSKFNLIY